MQRNWKEEIKVAKRRNKNTNSSLFCCLMHARLVLWSWPLRVSSHVVFEPHRDSILRNRRTEGEKAGEKVIFLSFFPSFSFFFNKIKQLLFSFCFSKFLTGFGLGCHTGRGFYSWKLVCNLQFFPFLLSLHRIYSLCLKSVLVLVLPLPTDGRVWLANLVLSGDSCTHTNTSTVITWALLKQLNMVLNLWHILCLGFRKHKSKLRWLVTEWMS